MGQGECEQTSKKPVREWAFEFFFYIAATLIHQVHIINAGGTGGHTGQAGQTPVDMFDYFFRGSQLMLKQVFQQVDTPARPVQFIAEQFERRAGGVAKTTMHTLAQDVICLLQPRFR